MTTAIELNPTVADADRVRLQRQCWTLLAALRERPLTNVEIAADLRILNGSGRISECRQAGCVITGTRLGGGRWLYTLEHCPEGLIA